MNISSINSTELLDAILRRDRIVVTFILVIVILACWFYLLSGAGTGMYPHKMVTLIPDQMNMDTTMPDMAGGSDHKTKTDESGHWSSSDILMYQVKWTTGYVFLMFSMWWLMMIAMMLPSASPMVLLHASISRKSLARVENQGPYTPSHRVILTTFSFISGYLAMWGLFSMVAVVAQ
jgi:predicted metal-binding membrane protein